ncbi:MAG: hypothetical protein ACK6AD_05685 [Cyanobacteriota bacterium]
MAAFLTPSQIEKYGARLLGNNLRPGIPHRWQQVLAIGALKSDATPPSLRALAVAAAQQLPEDDFARKFLKQSLILMREPRQLQVIAEVATEGWPERISMPLIRILMDVAFIPSHPPLQRVAVALACDDPTWLQDDGPEIVPPLLQAWRTAATKASAQDAIRSLRAPATIDALCRHWIETGEAGDGLVTLLLQAGHAPSAPTERAAFWLLSGQRQRYEALDRDGSLLARAQAGAPGPVRQRLQALATAAAAERSEWLQTMRQRKAISAFTTDDWAKTVQVLIRAGDAEALWRWAVRAPLVHARPLLEALPAGATPPPDLAGLIEQHQLLQVIAEVAAQGWPEQVSGSLIRILAKADFLPLEPPLARVAVALACGWSRRLAEDGPEILPPLLAAWSTETTKPQVRQAILELRAPATIHALCRLWIETGEVGDDLAALLLEAGHAPAEPAEQALFWLLIGQNARYEQLDLDGSLLAQAQVTAKASVRKRLAEAAAVAGHSQWLRAMQRSKPFAAYSPQDWTTTTSMLVRAADADTLWMWALQAPPLHSRALLCALPADANPPPSLGEGAGALQALARNLPPSPEEEGWLVDQGFLSRALRGHSATVEAIAWSPDGRHLASGGRDQTIQIWEPIHGTSLHTFHGYHLKRKAEPTSPWSTSCSLAWSPEGHGLAAICGETIRVWDPARGSCLHTLSDPAMKQPNAIAWSPDGSGLASLGDGTIRLWAAASGVCTPFSPFPPAEGAGHCLAWAPDGRTIAASSGDGSLVVVDVQSGRSINLHDLHGLQDAVTVLAWSPRGRLLAAAMGSTIRLWDQDTGRFIQTLEGHTAICRCLVWSPDGHGLASGGRDSTIRLWDPLRGTCRHVLRDPFGWWVHDLHWSPDGDCLVSCGFHPTLQLWDLTGSASLRKVKSQAHWVRAIASSPDGRFLASVGEEAIQLWREDAPQLKTLLETPLACFERRHWQLLAQCANSSASAQDWTAAWLTFISGLGAILRRFDVGVEEATQPAQGSSFEVLIDG